VEGSDGPRVRPQGVRGNGVREGKVLGVVRLRRGLGIGQAGARTRYGLDGLAGGWLVVGLPPGSTAVIP
jgi:hypothetical protein